MSRPRRNQDTPPVAASGANGATPKRTRTRIVTPATKAATLYNKLAALDEAEAEEIAAATPAGIRAKYEARRKKACEEADSAVMRLVQKMRVADEPEPETNAEARA